MRELRVADQEAGAGARTGLLIVTKQQGRPQVSINGVAAIRIRGERDTV